MYIQKLWYTFTLVQYSNLPILHTILREILAGQRVNFPASNVTDFWRLVSSSFTNLPFKGDTSLINSAPKIPSMILSRPATLITRTVLCNQIFILWQPTKYYTTGSWKAWHMSYGITNSTLRCTYKNNHIWYSNKKCIHILCVHANILQTVLGSWEQQC